MKNVKALAILLFGGLFTATSYVSVGVPAASAAMPCTPNVNGQWSGVFDANDTASGGPMSDAHTFGSGSAQLTIIQSDGHPGFEWQVFAFEMVIAYGNGTVSGTMFKISGTGTPRSPVRTVEATGTLNSCPNPMAASAAWSATYTDGSSVSNGTALCGLTANGTRLNATQLDGIRLLTGTRLDGARLNRARLHAMRLDGTRLTAMREDGSAVAGADFIGAQMVGDLSDGTTIPLRIESIIQAAAPNRDIYFYAVSYEADGTWHPLCGSDTLPNQAIPLAGTWNYNQGVPGGGAKTDDPSRFTFACRGYALAKCAEFGYKPWSSVRSVSLASYHQACTRMLRADYCGDGTPWTYDGTAIALRDGLGIKADAGRGVVEAEWNADGAVCTTPGMSRKAAPPCYSQLLSKTCGASEHLQTGALLINEHGKLSP